MHKERIRIEEKALKINEETAMKNRQRFVKEGVLVVNLMGAPGSGKTALLESLIPKLLKDGVKVAVIEGDVAGDSDSLRIRRIGAVAHQINTYGACHLLAEQVEHAYEHLLEEVDSSPDILFIENVGNLVCPAEFDLGESLRVVVYSVPEGEDKPLKYPLMFLRSQVVVLNKSDIGRYAGCDIEGLRRSVLTVNPAATVFITAAKTGEGVEKLAEWLKERTLNNRKTP
ncbi:MAG: hydrogenase nickel incorporation protein HypB [Planctomycetota bacterium]|nr:hydrogenase nickel incorporation protein HypB [Planctomycetota bacterium]